MNTVENIENISELFKTTRKFNGLLQSEFATMLGVRQGTISKVESGAMVPDIGLWFKLLKVFRILDPYCFTYTSLEYSKEAYDLLTVNGSILAPKFDFSLDNTISEIRKVRPLFDYLQIHDAKVLSKFLTNEKVEKEIFNILNHPIGVDFIDTFFHYVDEGKINSKSVALLNFDFSSSCGRNFDNLKTTNDFINQLCSEKLETEIFQYEHSKKENEYYVSIPKKNFQKIKDAEKLEMILDYYLLFPFHALKSIKGIGRSPKISEIKDMSKWQIQYAI